MLFEDEMTVHISDPKNSTRKLLQLINTFNNVTGNKINAENSVAIPYINDKRAEKETREISPSIIVTDHIEYLGGDSN